MFSRSLLFPIGFASAAITAFKTTNYSNAFRKKYLGVPIAVMALAQAQ